MAGKAIIIVDMLKDFIEECIERNVPIVELCKKYKIPMD